MVNAMKTSRIPQFDTLEDRCMMSASPLGDIGMPTAPGAQPAAMPQTREHVLLARQVGAPTGHRLTKIGHSTLVLPSAHHGAGAGKATFKEFTIKKLTDTAARPHASDIDGMRLADQFFARSGSTYYVGSANGGVWKTTNGR